MTRLDGEAIDRLARQQTGLVTFADLRRMGLTARRIGLLSASGALHPVRRRVYRVTGVAPSWEQCVHAAVLVTPPGTVASHRSAARLWCLAGVDTDLIELTALRQSRVGDVLIHRAQELSQADCTVICRIPVTTVARTLCDLSAVVPPAVLARAVDDALRRGLVTLRAVRRCAERLQVCGGRRRVSAILTLADARVAGPALGDSVLEGKVLRWLREAGEPDPVLQFRVRLGGRTYRPDLAYPDLRVAIELLGWEEHGKRSTFDHDRSRMNEFGIAGWLTLEFTDQHRREDVIGRVRAARLAQMDRLRALATGPRPSDEPQSADPEGRHFTIAITDQTCGADQAPASTRLARLA